jgi:hypothetical protein
MQHVETDDSRLWNKFVKLSRRTFNNNFSNLVKDAAKYAEAASVLKANFDVSAQYYRAFPCLILFLLTGACNDCPD